MDKFPLVYFTMVYALLVSTRQQYNYPYNHKRSLDFPSLILYLLNLRKHSNQVELDQFFTTIDPPGKRLKTIPKSAFFKAPKQLSHHAFIALNDVLIDTVYAQSSASKTWNGFRLCAIDGTSIRLPNAAGHC